MILGIVFMLLYYNMHDGPDPFLGQWTTLHMHRFIEWPFLELDLFAAKPLRVELQILKK